MQEDEATIPHSLAILLGIEPPPQRHKSAPVRRYACHDDSNDPPTVGIAKPQRAAVRNSPRRDEIHSMVKEGTFSVQEIACAMGVSKTTAHQHLRLLLAAGAVKRKKVATENGIWMLVYFAQD